MSGIDSAIEGVVIKGETTAITHGYLAIAQDLARHDTSLTAPLDESRINQLATSIMDFDNRLKGSSGEIIYAKFSIPNSEGRSNNRVYVVAKTDGNGLTTAIDPTTGRMQIEFGKDAVLLVSELNSGGTETATMTDLDKVKIPSGVKSSLFTTDRAIDLMIGEDEIASMTDMRSPSNAAWLAFVLEQAGVDTNTFFKSYFARYFGPGGMFEKHFNRHGTVVTKEDLREMEKNARKLIDGYRRNYGKQATPPKAIE